LTETKTSGSDGSTYDFAESFKRAPRDGRILSLDAKEYKRELRISAWSLRWVLSVRVSASFKRVQVDTVSFATCMPGQGPTFLIYRRQMLRLLRASKPAFEQLAIELPCLMGFRAREVCTWRAEYIDYVNGETLVLDAKKHELLSVPLNVQVARHAKEVLNARSKGYVLQSRSTAWQRVDRPISDTALWYIWQKWAKRIGVNQVNNISPVVGRRFFAAEWYYSQGLSLETLRRILRHTDFETTMRYVRSLVFWEDVKRDYDRFQLRLMQEAAEPTLSQEATA